MNGEKTKSFTRIEELEELALLRVFRYIVNNLTDVQINDDLIPKLKSIGGEMNE